MQHREDNNEFEWFYTSHLDSLFPSSVSYTAPSLPQLVTTNKGVDEKEKKRKERMEKNRVIARNCRKRKKAKLTAMETELAQLKSDKRDLELKVAKLQQLSAVTEVSYDADNTPVLPTREARNKQYRTINKLLGQYDKQKAKQEDTAAVVAEIQRRLHICEEMHSDFGKARKSEIGFHMNQLETLLIPNQLTKLSLWSLQQEDDFYDEATNTKTFGGGLWNTICQEFNLTADQKSSLLSMRDSIRDQRKNIYECLKILHELKSRVHTSFEQLRTQMIKIVKVTSPVQQARFLMWIESNQPWYFFLFFYIIVCQC